MRSLLEMTEKPPVADPTRVDEAAWGHLLHRIRRRMTPPDVAPLTARELLQTVGGLLCGLLLTAGIVAAIVLPSALQRLPRWDIVPLLALPLIWSVSLAIRT